MTPVPLDTRMLLHAHSGGENESNITTPCACIYTRLLVNNLVNILHLVLSPLTLQQCCLVSLAHFFCVCNFQTILMYFLTFPVFSVLFWVYSHSMNSEKWQGPLPDSNFPLERLLEVYSAFLKYRTLNTKRFGSGTP